jgi:hypothetical protein
VPKSRPGSDDPELIGGRALERLAEFEGLRGRNVDDPEMVGDQNDGDDVEVTDTGDADSPPESRTN